MDYESYHDAHFKWETIFRAASLILLACLLFTISFSAFAGSAKPTDRMHGLETVPWDQRCDYLISQEGSFIAEEITKFVLDENGKSVQFWTEEKMKQNLHDWAATSPYAPEWYMSLMEAWIHSAFAWQGNAEDWPKEGARLCRELHNVQGEISIPREMFSAEQVAILYAMAHNAAPHYPLPATAPVIHIAPKERLLGIACEEDQQCVLMSQHLQLKGMVWNGEIYIEDGMTFNHPDKEIEQKLVASVLFHEMIHYLQTSIKGELKDCEDLRDREAEAYQLQAQRLIKEGVPFNVVRSVTQTRINCEGRK